MKLPLPGNSDMVFQRLRQDRKGFDPWRPRNAAEVKKLVYYEFQMIDRAAKELGVKPANRISQAGAVFDLSSEAKARGAQRAVALLATALKEHDSARSRGLRTGSAWRALVRDPLDNALFNVQISQVEHLIKDRRFQQAEIACDRLRDRMENDSHKARLQSCYVAIFLAPAKQAAARGEYAAARELLDGLFSRYPLDAGEEATAFRYQLISDARKLVARAAEAGETRQGLELLEQAARIWPQLPEIERQRIELLTSHPILECAYRNLPRNLSPLGARTPVERHAVSLMFESLVRWVRDPAAGPHYETQLANGRPIPLAKGRRFILPRNNIWSDSSPGDPKLCFAEDVVWSLELLKKVRPPGCSPAWSQLIKSTNSQMNNPFSVSVRLRATIGSPCRCWISWSCRSIAFPTAGNPRKCASSTRIPSAQAPTY